MEEVEILPRDAYLHTVNIAQAPCTIQWWFSTKRKNIDFGLFMRTAPHGGDDGPPPSISRAGSGAQPGSRESTVGTAGGRQLAGLASGAQDSDGPRAVADAAAKQRGGYFKLQDRGAAALMPLKHYESSKTTIKGSWDAVQPGAYILYFDNSFSKNTSKRLSFCVAVKEAARQTGASASASRPSVTMSGWLLKKKRKRMQGWASRWISVQGRWLLYSTTEGGIPRAKVDIANAVVSTSKADLAITIDGDEGFLQLRAQTPDDFDAWVAALKKVKECFATNTAAATGGDGATLSAGAVVHSPVLAALDGLARQCVTPRDDVAATGVDATRIQQVHADFESAVERLDLLLRGLGGSPGMAFREKAQGCLQQIRDSGGILHGLLVSAAAAPGLTRRNTAASERPSLPGTDSWSSRVSVSGSEVFYDTNEVLELVRDGADASPPIGPLQHADHWPGDSIGSGSTDAEAAAGLGKAAAACPDGEMDSASDSDAGEGDFDDGSARGSGVLRLDRMRIDLIRDPDFIEALAKNSLRSPRAAGAASDADTQPGKAAAAGGDEFEEDADQWPLSTIERVRAQTAPYEPRTSLPAEAGEVNVSLISILRKNVGRELTSIAMPLVMNEPINALQALCEEMRFSRLLQQADEMDDSLDRMMYVAAFAVGVLSLKKNRAERKPFNPLLGETYELVDPLSGFRFVSEKVSHHPPVMACYADSPSYRLWQDSSGKSKFWGKSMEFVQTSSVHIELLAHGDHFTYCKPSALVRGLISGNRTIDFTGEMVITNHATGDQCTVNFKEATLFSSSDDMVECHLRRGGARGVERVLRGSWSSHLRYERAPARAETLWTAAALPPTADRFYGFSYFTMRLNELLPAVAPDLPPTDTRFRPDQRAYEHGDIDAAEAVKTELEEAQRMRNREREAAGAAWVPQWFEETDDPESPSGRSWVYKGGYWDARARRAFPPAVALWEPAGSPAGRAAS